MLLLRSGKTETAHTRVDGLITDVRAMELRCWSVGLKIELRDTEFLAGFRSNPSETIEIGNKVYSVDGDDWHGYVVGGAFFSNEDDGEFHDPSELGV
jgi:hypothetical protein